MGAAAQKSSSSSSSSKWPRGLPAGVQGLARAALGIGLRPEERPVLASALHLLTVGSAGGMLLLRVFFSGYDISSGSDVADGAVVLGMTLLLCLLGTYSHRLLFRLMTHRKMMRMMRMHAKTVAKLNAAAVITLCLLVLVLVVNADTAQYFYPRPDDVTNGTLATKTTTTTTSTSGSDGGDPAVVMNPCLKIDIPLWICQAYYVSQVVFSAAFLVWNGAVAAVLVSVARTHTISIRRMMTSFAHDAHLIDKDLRRKFYPEKSKEFKDSMRDYIWVDTDQMSELMRDDGDPAPDPHQERPRGGAGAHDPGNGSDIVAMASHAEEEIDGEEPTFFIQDTGIQLQLSEEIGSSGNPRRENRRRLQKMVEAMSVFSSFRPLSEDDQEDVMEIPHILSEEEILHKYWKVSMGTRLTSQAFQRWMCLVIVTVMCWSSLELVYWLSHKPTTLGILSFCLPLFILPLIASSYAEVNLESQRALQALLPTKERLRMFIYLNGHPIQMTCYGHPVTYGNMGTILAAVLAAIASKIILQEMNKILV